MAAPPQLVTIKRIHLLREKKLILYLYRQPTKLEGGNVFTGFPFQGMRPETHTPEDLVAATTSTVGKWTVGILLE